MVSDRSRSGRNRGRLGLAVIIAAALLAAVGWRVDLTPRVESDFFFSSNDPQLRATERIGELFPTSPQVLIYAPGNVVEASYLERLGELTAALAEVPGVRKVYSLTSGPPNPSEVADSPLWRRLLLPSPETGTPAALERAGSTVLLQIEEDSPREMVAQIEEVANLFSIANENSGLQISGVPYVTELIRRQLRRDLQTFTLAALLIFGLAVAWIYRSLTVVAGTLLSALCSCAATLLVLPGGVGLLTANIVTIVFVLTLSHVVFLNANWRRLSTEADPSAGARAGDAKGRVGEANGHSLARRAVRATLPASFWCMVTTVLGFGSLRLTSARPLQELGLAGACGAIFALAAAFLYYPLFLSAVGDRAGRRDSPTSPQAWLRPWLDRRLAGGVLLFFIAAAIAAAGLLHLETDPSLLSYFQKGSPLRQGLESLDASGGSSPLTLVLADPGGARLDSGPPFEHLEAVQAAIELEPEVGTALSLPVLLAEARRAPLANFLGQEQLLAILSSPAFDQIARGFVTDDRKLALLFLRMREGQRSGSRQEVVARLAELAESKGLQVTMTGGLYDLQGQLSHLVTSSLLAGLGGLTVLFIVIAAAVARRLRAALVMGAGLLTIPLLILGTLGHLRLPLDVIASPAANVAIALGIDSMIHLVLRVRRLESRGLAGWAAWVEARRQLAMPILTAMAVIGAGFGIFALSSFPPTRNFGIAVVVGTLAAGALATVILPFLATGRRSG